MTAHTLEPALTRLTASIGVEVHGLDLGRGLDTRVLGLLRIAVAEHHMVVLRGQHLSTDQHAAVARAFGPILRSPVQMATGVQTVTVSTIEDTASRPPEGFPWHTDLSWIPRPPAFGFLSAVTIPEFGGDTIWASTAAMFDALPPDVRERCERSALVHAPDPSLLASVERHHGTTMAERLRRDHPGVEHPLVATHPITSRRSLFLSPLYAHRMVGPPGVDGHLLNRLNSILDDPHVQVRWRWSAGDFVIWDETSTCHRALTDHHPQRRVMRRCVTSAQ